MLEKLKQEEYTELNNSLFMGNLMGNMDEKVKNMLGIDDNKSSDDLKTKPKRPGMPAYDWEKPDDPEKEPHIVIKDGPHEGERYDNPEDYKNSNKSGDDDLMNPSNPKYKGFTNSFSSDSIVSS